MRRTNNEARNLIMATPDIRIERWNRPSWNPGEDITGPPTRHDVGTLIQPADRSWGLWLDENGQPTIYSQRIPGDGAVIDETIMEIGYPFAKCSIAHNAPQTSITSTP